MNDHIVRAKEYLAIAESADSKTEAYKAAAEEVAAYKEETGESNSRAAALLGRKTGYVEKLLAWRTRGYDAETPWRREGKDAGAARAHTKRVLREAPMEQIEQIISELPASRQRQIGAAAGDTYLRKVNEVADNTRRNVTEGVGRFSAPTLAFEERALLAKLREAKEYLDAHGDEMIPDDEGGPAESIRDLTLGAYAASKGRIDNAFAELGVGTSIEEGFRNLLSSGN